MRSFLQFISILSIVLASIKLAMMGNLSAQTTGIILVGAILILALGKKGIKVVATLLGLYLFIKIYSGDNYETNMNLLVPIISLCFIGFILYRMFKRLFS